MPLFLAIAIIILLVFLAVRASRTSRGVSKWLESRFYNVVIFVLSLVSLVISVFLLLNMADYADEFGSSPVLVTGGWFWLNMYWLRLGLLFMLCLISGLKLVRRAK